MNGSILVLVSIFFRMFFSLSAYADTATFYATCPDFSGSYLGTFDESDFRGQELLNLKQHGCDKIEENSEITFKKGGVSSKTSFTWEFAPSANTEGKPYWDGDRLVSFQKNATSELCDIRDYFVLNKNKNLVYRWRFECPSTSGYFRGTNGISPWYRDNIVKGTWFRR